MLDVTQVIHQLHDQTTTWQAQWETRQAAIQQVQGWVTDTANWMPAARDSQLARWRWPGCWPTEELAA
ncbi:MAG: hypothetical protein KDD89_15925, partial [Anaerolineales bacterium]|nr:hypothetical protein [Anaerolineales bacterium]